METFRPKLILVPTDLSETAAHALRYASALADRLDAHLLVIHADSFIPAVDFTAVPASSFDLAQQQLIDQARESLEKQTEENVGRNVPFDIRVVVGSPVNAIVSQARESGADLIVMGTHGRSGLGRLLFGSVTDAVMRMAPAPVIAVSPTSLETGQVRRVLCNVTFEPTCIQALRCAADLTQNPYSELLLLHLVSDLRLQDTIDDLVRLENWVPEDLAERCEFKILPDRSGDRRITAFAKVRAIDLIALGVRSDRSIAEFLGGTLAENIIRQSGCPVLAVNPNVAGAQGGSHEQHALSAVGN